MRRSYSQEPEVALDCRNCLGECPIWDDRAGLLCWTDIEGRALWSWDPFGDAAPVVTPMPERVGAFGLREGGGYVLALEKSFALWRDGRLDIVARLDDAPATTRLNDGRVDAGGRFVCGGMDEGAPQQPLSKLYSLARGGASALLANVYCTNSVCWSLDGRTLYFTNMPTRRIDAFDYDPDTGAIANPREFASLAGEPGLADGSIVDAEGCLWNAQWRGSKLVRYRPDGGVDREVKLPVSNPTCMAFGGPDLDILFVTSAWITLSMEERAAQPHAGSLFAFRPGVRGRKEARYAG